MVLVNLQKTYTNLFYDILANLLKFKLLFIKLN